MRPSADAVSNLLLTLYAAPSQPELWPRFLSDFTTLLGLPGAAILHQNLAKEKYGFSVAIGIDPAAQISYGEYFGKVDPFRARFLAKAEGELCLAEELCPSSVLHKTELYGDYLSKYDFTLCCAVATIKRAATSEFISIYQDLESGPPDPETIAMITMIIPHIRAALNLRSQLCDIDVAAKNYAAALDSLNAGIVLLTEQAECIFVSRKIEDLCSANNGIYIKNARLGAYAPADHQALSRLIDRAIALAVRKTTEPCGTALISRRNRAPLKVSAASLSPEAPLAQAAMGPSAVAALFVRDPEQDAVSLPQILAATYALTATETRLAVNLLEGYSLTQTAERHAVSIETVRSQLKSIFTKTATRRQTELLVLLSHLTNR
ncbi:MAG TPA: helix-turn-helix transcriptional regulator [Steroidobacteraceae bacterium]